MPLLTSQRVLLRVPGYTKPQWNRLSKKQHLLPASYVSAAVRLRHSEPQAPYAPSWLTAAQPLHFTFTESLLVQNEQST